MNCGHQNYAFRCSCCGALYCSEACQRVDWQEHRKICAGEDGTVHSEHKVLQEIRSALGDNAVEAFRVKDRKNTYRLDPAWVQIESIDGRLGPKLLKDNQAFLAYLSVPDQPNYRVRFIVEHKPNYQGATKFKPDPKHRIIKAVVQYTIDFLQSREGRATRLALIHEGDLYLLANAEQFTNEALPIPSINEVEWADVLRSVFLADEIAMPMETMLSIMNHKIGRVNRLWPKYSFRNRLFLLSQFIARGLEPEPMRTFGQWIKNKRSVVKDAKAFGVVVPVKALSSQETHEAQDEFKGFVVKKMLYSYSQTKPRGKKAEDKSADAYLPPPLPAFDPEQALRNLKIDAKIITKTEPDTEPNTEPDIEASMFHKYLAAYSIGRTIYLHAMDSSAWRCMFHEIGHILLGHNEPSYDYDAKRPEAELEAESVSLLCNMALGIEGSEESLVYIRKWFQTDTYPENSARRVIAAARKILEAGGVKPTSEDVAT